MKVKPDVVLSGVNYGQNLGTLTNVSGTVGAARKAAALGIPAAAFSQGLNGSAAPDFATGAKTAVAWLNQHRKAIVGAKGKKANGVVTLESVNIPTCLGGTKVRGTLKTTIATTNENAITAQNCASTVKPTNDIEAFNNGYITVTQIPVTPTP